MADVLYLTIHQVKKLERRFFLFWLAGNDADVKVALTRYDEAVIKRREEQQKEAIEEACTDLFLRRYSAKTLDERIGLLNRKYPAACMTKTKLW